MWLQTLAGMDAARRPLFNKNRGIHPKRTRYREKRAAPTEMWTRHWTRNGGGGDPARGSGNNLNLNAAINPSNFVIPSGRHRNGRRQEDVFLNRELWLHARVIPVAFPSRKDRPHHQGRRREPEKEWTWINNDQRPQVWKQGLPKADHGNQPDKNDHPPG